MNPVSKTRNFVFKNEGLCIQNDELCSDGMTSEATFKHMVNTLRLRLIGQNRPIVRSTFRRFLDRITSARMVPFLADEAEGFR